MMTCEWKGALGTAIGMLWGDLNQWRDGSWGLL